jgi:hypothetical protein
LPRTGGEAKILAEPPGKFMPLFDRNMDFKIPQVSWKRQRPLFMGYSPWGDTWKIRRDISSGTAGTLLRHVTYDPSQNRARGDPDAEFPGQLGQISVTKLKAQIPAYAGKDHLIGEPTSTKERVTR